MNLIFIYGPPAVGKLTIAEGVAKSTGYKLFHNHMTMDLAQEIYPEFGDLRFNLVDRLRLDVFGFAAENQTNLVSTYVYSGDDNDDKFIFNTKAVIEQSGGKVLFVELYAPSNVLLGRVSSKSRQQFHKLKDPEILRDQLNDRLYEKSVHYPGICKIDTSIKDPSQAAEKIIKHFNLF